MRRWSVPLSVSARCDTGLPSIARVLIRSCGGWAAAAVAVLVFQTLGSAQASHPLPDSQQFLDAVRQNLAKSQEVQKQFAYRERRTDLDFNPFGHMGTGGTRMYEVTPAADGAAISRRLLEKDGQPVANAPIERIERRPPRSRSMVDDVAATLEVALDRRDMLEGRQAIVVRFKPRPDANPSTREGRIARNFKGLIWVDEESREVAKIDATAIDDISFGYGLLARMKEGSAVTVRRQPVDGHVWLPVSVRFVGEGRALLVRKLVVNFVVDWFDYRRVP